MNKLVFANLLHRPVRSLISIFGVAIEVAMILSIVAVMMGKVDDQRERGNGIGADVLVMPSNGSMIFGLNGASMPINDVTALRQLPHVAIASPTNTYTSMNSGMEVIWGIDYDSFNAMRPFTYIAGGPFQGSNDVIIDDIMANNGNGYHVGDSILVFKRPMHICGIVEHGRGGRKLIQLETLNQMLGTEGKASMFLVKADKPADTNLVKQEILSRKGFTQNRVITMDEWTTLMSPEHLPGFTIALNVVITIAVIVGFLVIFQSMYTAVFERTREIGILKSMGASKTSIITVVLRETLALVSIGILVGIALTFGIRGIIAIKYPTFEFELTMAWIVRGAFIALLGSIIGAMYPAILAARKDPIDALAYE